MLYELYSNMLIDRICGRGILGKTLSFIHHSGLWTEIQCFQRFSPIVFEYQRVIMLKCIKREGQVDGVIPGIVSDQLLNIKVHVEKIMIYC